MIFYDFFLKFYALKFLFVKDPTIEDDDIEFNEIVISINNNGDLSQEINIKSENCLNDILLKTLAISYFSIICIAIGWECIYSIVKSIIELNGLYFTSSIFSFMYLGQLITGAIFYNSEFFSNIIKKLKDYHTILLIMLVIANAISIILALVEIILLINGYNIVNYSYLYLSASPYQQVILIISLFVRSFYSYNIFFVNIIIFAAILNYQRLQILDYRNKLKVILNSNVQDIKIISIITDFTKMQSSYKKSVDKLNNIFTFVTIIGLVGSYFVLSLINTPFSSIYSYINMGLFFMIEAVYIFVINKINDTNQSIRTLIGSDIFVSKFLNRNNLGPIYGDIYDELQNNQNINSKIDLIKNMTFRNTIISNENGTELDWIVLYNKLSESWASFKLLSYQFDDTQIIQKLVVIILGLSAIIRINYKIGF